MNPITFSQLKSNWQNEENIELQQKRRRRYLHFDGVIEKVSPQIFKKITDNKFVAKYGFLPLLRRSQVSRLYKRDPVTRKKTIKKKERPISYAAHFDALVYSWYAHHIQFRYENCIQKSSINSSVIAYRSLKKSNVDFAKDVFDFVKSKGDCTVIAFDIKDFYGSLNHKLLKQAWADLFERKDLAADHYQVFKSITKFSYVEIDEIKKILNLGTKDLKKLRLFLNIDLLETLRSKEKIIKNPKDKGIPQGTPISCVLSNLYMLDFDTKIESLVRQIGGLYRRYSDDMIVVCPKDKAEEINTRLNQAITNAKLEIEPSKTEIRYFKIVEDRLQCFNEKGKPSKLQYLGVVFDGKNFSLRHKGYAKFERKMTRKIRQEAKIAKERRVGIAKRKIYESFSPLGKTNYVSYALRSSITLKSAVTKKLVAPGKIFKKIKQKIVKSTDDLN